MTNEFGLRSWSTLPAPWVGIPSRKSAQELNRDVRRRRPVLQARRVAVELERAAHRLERPALRLEVVHLLVLVVVAEAERVRLLHPLEARSTPTY